MKAPYTRLTLACLGVVWWFNGSLAVGQQTADRDFRVTVAEPAYEDVHPKVLFDEAHFNVHTTQGSYKIFVDLVTNDGYQVTVNDKPFDGMVLAGYDILVIANARGAPRPSEKPAFTDAECDAVRDWVQGGGGLLLVTDHYPTGHAAQNLGKRFGVEMSKGTMTDPGRAAPETRGGVLIFSRDENLLGEHPITLGRRESERINCVATFTGQSLKGPEHSAVLLKCSDTAIDRLPSSAGDDSSLLRGRVRSRRPPVAGVSELTTSAAGHSQGLALRFGKGRVVVLGEASQITAQQAGPLQRPMGMNYPDCDNRQWTLNIMHWLSGLLNESVPQESTSGLGQAEPPTDKPRSPAAPTQPSTGSQGINQTPILLTGPADWRFEKMSLPPGFAPDVRLRGFEEARFAPGMFDTGAPDYFTYLIALSIEGDELIDAAAIKEFLDSYYRGLSSTVGRRKQLAIDYSKISAMVAPATAGEPGSRYQARVTYFDTFNDGRKVELNVEIKVAAKPDTKRTFVTWLISPQPFAAEVWKKLHEIQKTVAFEGP